MKQKIKDLLKDKNLVVGVLLFIIGVIVNQVASLFLSSKFAEGGLPILNDLCLDNLPYIKIAWMYDLFIIIPAVIFLIYTYKKDLKSTPYFLILFGLSQLLRGVFIMLTPFGSPNNGLIGLFKGAAFRNGVYPSGHTQSAFLFFLLAKGIYKKIIFVFFLLLIMALLLGRGHYSIDIFSAILFNYAIYCFGEKYLKKYFKKEVKVEDKK